MRAVPPLPLDNYVEEAQSSEGMTNDPYRIQFDGSYQPPRGPSEIATEDASGTPRAKVGFLLHNEITSEEEPYSLPIDANEEILTTHGSMYVEYLAIRSALQTLVDRGETGHVTLFGDAKSALDVLSGRGTPHCMEPLVADICALLAEFTTYRTVFEPRGGNTAAHTLASEPWRY
jgi:ribonuclease HI